jgi:hypothetical protein
MGLGAPFPNSRHKWRAHSAADPKPIEILGCGSATVHSPAERMLHAKNKAKASLALEFGPVSSPIPRTRNGAHEISSRRNRLHLVSEDNLI